MTDLVERLRQPWEHQEALCGYAADALDAQAQRIADLERNLGEAKRTLPCGCHHSLDDSYGNCVLHTTIASHTKLEEGK